MKSDDLLTDAELRSRMTETVSDLRQQADADQTALTVEGDNYAGDLESSAYGEIIAKEPGVAAAMPKDNYSGLGGETLDVGSTDYEVRFNESRRRALGAIAGGMDGFIAIVLQEAIDTIDEIREVTDELAAESAQLAAAAASGVLIPPTKEDLEDFDDELVAAQKQARLVNRELQNLQARRQATRVANGSEDLPDGFPVVRSIPNRPLVRTPAASEPEDRGDQGLSLVQGTPGQTRSSVAADQAAQLQDLLRKPALDRINYILLCAAIGNMTRSKTSRDKAAKALTKLKRVYASIKELLSGGFLNELQANLEEQAAQSASRALDFIQTKLDAVDGFMKVASGLPGPFVSTVRAIGDVPDTAPVINSLSSLCGLKGSRFCDLKGLLEVAKSLDVEFGLKIPTPPMIGRALFTLDAPPVESSPDPVTIPGQEADLLLQELDDIHLHAYFSGADKKLRFSAGAFKERNDVFGNGPGKIIILGVGTNEDIETTYVDPPVFDEVNRVWSFVVASTAKQLNLVVRCESDKATLVPSSWDETSTFPIGSSTITLRVPEAQRRDLKFPCTLALGYGEQALFNGEYDTTDANVVRAFAPVFESWMVGQKIQLGTSTGNGTGTERTIITFINSQTIRYDGADVPATNSGNRSSFLLSIDRFETIQATGMEDGPHPDLKKFFLVGQTTRDHGRQYASFQRTVRVVPDVRDQFLNSSQTPADGDVRDEDILPAGSQEFLATYQDQNQKDLFNALLVNHAGKAYINGQGPYSYTSAKKETVAGEQLRFFLSSGTPTSFLAGALVEVETTSLLDDFSVQFPDEWFAPFDAWLLQLGLELSKLEAKFCRMLSGSNQDIAASAASLTNLSVSVSLALTLARFTLVAWLTPLVQAKSLTSALEDLDAIGAKRATRQLREGRVGDFAAMAPAEGSDAGSALIVAQSYEKRVTTEEQRRILAKSVAEYRGKTEALVVAANAVGDLQAAQQAEIQRRRDGARRIEALQEKLP